MTTAETIPTAVDSCARNFLSLAENLRKSTRFADQMTSESVLNEFDRFKLWAGNIAAHRKGRRSLEYRLRDATSLYTETYHLLMSLSSALHNSSAIVQGDRIPWDEEVYSDSGSEILDDDRDIEDPQDDTEIKQLYVSIGSAITALMRISIAIREPAPNRQSRTIDKSHFEHHDMLHVQAKFPNAAQYLTERLGRAISSRRQYLTYREIHHDKLSKGIEKLGLEAARTETTTNSTEATKLQRTNSLNLLDEDDDTSSQTSYATSINATLRAPKLPKEARERDHYNCPLCFALIDIHTTAAWKKHLYQDLHPYCCTFEDCKTADRLYDSRHAWFAHEVEAHKSSFECIEGCSDVFQAEFDFETHVRSKHDNLTVPSIYSAFRRSSVRTARLSEQVVCQLCDRRMTLRAMQKHLGHHQEQLALFALPANLDDTDEDPDEEDQGSMFRTEMNRARERDMDEGTDTSDDPKEEQIAEDPVTEKDLLKELPSGTSWYPSNQPPQTGTLNEQQLSLSDTAPLKYLGANTYSTGGDSDDDNEADFADLNFSPSLITDPIKSLRENRVLEDHQGQLMLLEHQNEFSGRKQVPAMELVEEALEASSAAGFRDAHSRDHEYQEVSGDRTVNSAATKADADQNDFLFSNDLGFSPDEFSRLRDSDLFGSSALNQPESDTRVFEPRSGNNESEHMEHQQWAANAYNARGAMKEKNIPEDIPQIAGRSSPTPFSIPSPTPSEISVTHPTVQEILRCHVQGCDARFNGTHRRGNFCRHLRLVHDRKEYLCGIDGCSKVYRRSDARSKHQSKWHFRAMP